MASRAKPEDESKAVGPDPTKVGYLTHQLNQPLTAINNYALAGCQLLDQGMCDSAQSRELFEKICREVNRAAALTRELAAFSDDPEAPPRQG